MSMPGFPPPCQYWMLSVFLIFVNFVNWLGEKRIQCSPNQTVNLATIKLHFHPPFGPHPELGDQQWGVRAWVCLFTLLLSSDSSHPWEGMVWLLWGHCQGQGREGKREKGKGLLAWLGHVSLSLGSHVIPSTAFFLGGALTGIPDAGSMCAPHPFLPSPCFWHSLLLSACPLWAPVAPQADSQLHHLL